MRRLLFVILCVILGAGTAAGQTTATPAPVEAIKALLERIGRLEARLGELEGKLSSQPAACSMPANFSAGHNAVRETIIPPRESANRHQTCRFEFAESYAGSPS